MSSLGAAWECICSKSVLCHPILHYFVSDEPVEATRTHFRSLYFLSGALLPVGFRSAAPDSPREAPS